MSSLNLIALEVFLSGINKAWHTGGALKKHLLIFAELLAAHAHAHHTTSHQSTSLASASQSPSNHNLTPSSNLASAHGAGSVQSQPPLATAQLMNTNTMQGLSSLSEPVPEQKLPDDIWLAPPMANEGDGVGMGLSGMDSGKGWYGGTGNGGMDAGGGNRTFGSSSHLAHQVGLPSWLLVRVPPNLCCVRLGGS